MDKLFRMNLGSIVVSLIVSHVFLENILVQF